MIIVLVGPSGVGKDTILKKLLMWDKDLDVAVSHTSRDQRPGERHATDYHFCSREQFEMMYHREEFIETNEFDGNLYGIKKSSLKDVINRNKTPVVILDVNGADALISNYDDVLSIFIEPPSLPELRKRLVKRGDSEEDIERRLVIAGDEINHAFKYNYRIKNDKVQQAATRVLGCIHEHVY